MWKEGEKDSRNDEQRASRIGWEMMFGDDGDCFLFRKKASKLAISSNVQL